MTLQETILTLRTLSQKKIGWCNGPVLFESCPFTDLVGFQCLVHFNRDVKQQSGGLHYTILGDQASACDRWHGYAGLVSPRGLVGMIHLWVSEFHTASQSLMVHSQMSQCRAGAGHAVGMLSPGAVTATAAITSFPLWVHWRALESTDYLSGWWLWALSWLDPHEIPLQYFCPGAKKTQKKKKKKPQHRSGMLEKHSYMLISTSEHASWKNRGHMGVEQEPRCDCLSSVFVSPHFLQTTLVCTPYLEPLAVWFLCVSCNEQYGCKLRWSATQSRYRLNPMSKSAHGAIQWSGCSQILFPGILSPHVFLITLRLQCGLGVTLMADMAAWA